MACSDVPRRTLSLTLPLPPNRLVIACTAPNPTADGSTFSEIGLPVVTFCAAVLAAPSVAPSTAPAARRAKNPAIPAAPIFPVTRAITLCSGFGRYRQINAWLTPVTWLERNALTAASSSLKPSDLAFVYCSPMVSPAV